MANKFIDYLGHVVPDANGPALTAGVGGTTAAGTIVPVTAGAGVGATVTLPLGNDRRGSFLLTAAGTPAAGKVATVFFANQYAAAPFAVVINIQDQTDGTTPVNGSAYQVTQGKFDIATEVLVAGKAYIVQYIVEA